MKLSKGTLNINPELHEQAKNIKVLWGNEELAPIIKNIKAEIIFTEENKKLIDGLKKHFSIKVMEVEDGRRENNKRKSSKEPREEMEK